MRTKQMPTTLDSVQGYVQRILTEVPDARDSDALLYLLVLESAGANIVNLTVLDLLTNPKEYPHFETVRRTRQKIQEKNPELRSSVAVQKFRQNNEIAIRGWLECN